METLTRDFLRAQAEREAPYSPDSAQEVLTRQHLLPHLQSLMTDLLRLRGDFDLAAGHLRQIAGRRYPVGFCREISDGVLSLIVREIKTPTSEGLQALRTFCSAGGMVKRVWGNLRNSYFQNALQVGDLYVDVANDSVVTTKPKVEILPFAQADFHPIRHYQDYATLAESYWKVRVIPNLYLPDLLPLYPMLLAYPSGRVKLHAPYQSLFYQNLLDEFVPAENFVLRSAWSMQGFAPAEIESLQRSTAQTGVRILPAVMNATDVFDIFCAARNEELYFHAPACQALIDQQQRFDAQAKIDSIAKASTPA